MADLEKSLNQLNTSFQGLAGTIGAANLDRKNREFAQQEAEKQRLWNEQMYNQQNAWNYEMWHRTNEYNTPEAHLKRLRDAGLNPLYYGLDGSSASAMEAAQPLGYERASYQSTINPVLSGADASIKAAQVSSIELDNELKRKELGWYDKEHSQEFDFKSASIDQIRQNIIEMQSRIRNNDADTLLKTKGIDKAEAETATEWARVSASSARIRSASNWLRTSES